MSKNQKTSSGFAVSRRARAEEGGAVLLELCFVVPILLVLSIFTIEFIKIMEQKQIISVLNREVTSQVFRQCAWARGPTPSDPSDERKACIERLIGGQPALGFTNGLEDLGLAVFGRRPEVVFSIYEKTPAGTGTRIVVVPNGGVTYTSGRQTRFTVNDAAFSTPEFQDLLNKQNRVVVGEVFFQYEPVLSANIPYVWNLTDIWLYNVTLK